MARILWCGGLSVRCISVLFGVVLLAGVAASPHPILADSVPPATPTASVLAGEAAGLVTALNAQRTENGVAPLTVDPSLMTLAQARSADQVARHYFGHFTPDGKDIFDLLNAGGIPWTYAGENLAESQNTDPVQAAVTNFLHSPEHRANMLNPDYGNVGVGAAITADGMTILTVVFTN